MKRSRWIAVLLCVACLPLGAAGAQENRQCSPDDVRVALKLRSARVPDGERVRMRIVAANTSGKACEMQFPSGRGGTVRVFRDDDLVWEHGYCRVYTDHIEIETWEPGRREVYRFGWGQRENAMDENGRIDCEGEKTDAPPGRYRARGIFFGTQPDAKTARVAFRITD